MNSGRCMLAMVVALAMLAACAAPRTPVSPGTAVERSAPSRTSARVSPRDPRHVSRGVSGLRGRYAEALEHLKTGNWSEAESLLRSLSKEYPDYVGPWINLGILHARTERPQEAVQALSRALVLQPENPVALTWKGILHRQAGEHARAEEAYRKALEAQPHYKLAHLNLGILYDQYLRRPEAALHHYRRYRELAGSDDLRVSVWIAELESGSKAAATAAASPTPARSP